MGLFSRIRDAIAPSPAAAGQLTPARSWSRRASRGQRPRLAAGPDGRLLCVWTEPLGPKKWRAVLEDAGGAVLEEQQMAVGNAEYHPAYVCEGRILVRDGLDLRWGGHSVASGAWEAYAGTGQAIIAWAPCQVRPCKALIVASTGAAFLGLELFGVDLAEAGPGAVAMATRETGNSAGWTLRLCDADVLAQGQVAVLEPKQAWKPPRGLSLEDPYLVRGSVVPMIVGSAFDTAAVKPSGKVFLAESGGSLRQVLQAARSEGNAEIAAAINATGTLHVAAELVDGVGIWKWVAGKMRPAGKAPGKAPSLAAAEGSLWLSSTAGLFRL